MEHSKPLQKLATDGIGAEVDEGFDLSLSNPL